MQYEIANVYFQAFDGTHCEYAQTDGQGKSTSGLYVYQMSNQFKFGGALTSFSLTPFYITPASLSESRIH